MIQRIQTLWLIVVALCAFATYTLTLYVGTTVEGAEKVLQLGNDFILVIPIIALGLLAIINLFLFKNRKLQFRLSILGMFLSIGFIFLEYFRVESFKIDNVIQTGTYQLGALLPIVMVIFFFLAARGIYRDTKLIKSMDRLR